MSGYGGFASDMDAAERRRMRAEIARERVASGTTTARPNASPAPTTAKKATSPKGSGAATKVDPALAPGTAYGVWRSLQHFTVSDSLPDAVCTDLDRLVRWSGQLMPFRLRQRLLARLDSQGVWHPVALVEDGHQQAITRRQADRFRDARLQPDPEIPTDGRRVLSAGDHPEVSLSL